MFGMGTATLTFSASPQAAQTVTTQVVTDSVPQPDPRTFGWKRLLTNCPITTFPNGNYAAYDSGKLIAIGQISGVDNVAFSSDNGDTWTTAVIPSTANGWWSIGAGNGIYVIISSSGSTAALRSTDCINWTSSTLPVGSASSSVYFGNGTFFIPISSSNAGLTSVDGITWASNPLPSFFGSYPYFDGTKFINCTTINNNLYTSTDAITWTVVTNSFPAGDSFPNRFGKIGNTYIKIKDNTGVIYTSLDLINWDGPFKFPMEYTPNMGLITDIFGSGTSLLLSTQGTAVLDNLDFDNIKLFKQAQLPLAPPTLTDKGVAMISINSLPSFIWIPEQKNLTPNTRTISSVSKEVVSAKPSPGSNAASVVVTGLPNIGATTSISAFMVGSDSTGDHNAYEHELADIKLSIDDVVNGVGFTINAVSPTRLVGDYKVRYIWRT